VVLPVALIMYAGIVFLFIPWTAILNPLGDFLNGLIVYTNSALFYIQDLPFASIGGIWISTFQYLLIYLIILCIIWAGLSAIKFAVYLGIGFILLLSMSVSYKNIQNSNHQELIFYSLRKSSAIAYIDNRKAYLISDLTNDEKARSFSINPAIESRGVSDIKNIRIGSVFSDDEMKVSSFYMQFGNYRLIRWTNEQDDVLFSRKLQSDMILLSGNPRIQVKQLTENIRFSVLLIDASNFDYRIRQWQSEAKSLNIPVHVLKKQPAYVLKL
jgi:competence protein ComEC